MQALLEVILPVFLVIGFGYVAVWRGFFTQSGVDGLMKFSQNFAIPCLLFSAIENLDLSASLDLRLLTSFYVGAAAGFAVGTAGAFYIFNRNIEDSIAIGFCCLFSNSVLLGLAINERAYGPEALSGAFTIIAFHSPFCYGLGITAMEIARNRGQGALTMARGVAKAMFRNVLVLAIMAGFAVNLSGLTLPDVLQDGLDLVVRAALPTALFALGGVLIQYRPEGDARVIAMVCAISLLLHPAITFGLGNALSVPADLHKTTVLTAAMAPGVNGYIFANMYGRAKRVAATSVLVATALTILTAWMWLVVLG
ncbi:AEC family transporter [Tateyamaria sp. ANG-S1]|uniref:AEC family transporter n=1 Tax=Tateyamaria sp. ANG-S1 TaxID=1577905 RepID=UPI00057FFD5F|nr:AEC family transporter [Tateyamaria sp. ANG-S1]KIC51082.1 malonate transporter [Tateyamaria sp. ANG-S1]